MIPSAAANEIAIGIVEVEVAGELIGRRLAVKLAIAALLRLGQKANRHGDRLAKLLSSAGPHGSPENLGIWTCEI